MSPLNIEQNPARKLILGFCKIIYKYKFEKTKCMRVILSWIKLKYFIDLDENNMFIKNIGCGMISCLFCIMSL